MLISHVSARGPPSCARVLLLLFQPGQCLGTRTRGPLGGERRHFTNEFAGAVRIGPYEKPLRLILARRAQFVLYTKSLLRNLESPSQHVSQIVDGRAWLSCQYASGIRYGVDSSPAILPCHSRLGDQNGRFVAALPALDQIWSVQLQHFRKRMCVPDARAPEQASSTMRSPIRNRLIPIDRNSIRRAVNMPNQRSPPVHQTTLHAGQGKTVAAKNQLSTGKRKHGMQSVHGRLARTKTSRSGTGPNWYKEKEKKKGLAAQFHVVSSK